jgi:hypothetical protein
MARLLFVDAVSIPIFYKEGLSPILGAGLAIVTGIASFYLLENPARRCLNRKWGQPRAAEVRQNPGQISDFP